MATNYLITGHHGTPHVTAENDRGINAAIFGAGRKVLAVGQQFRAEYIGNSTVRMYDGKLCDGGAVAGIPAGQYIDLKISETSQGRKRNDIIIFKYTQNASSLVESGTFEVKKGTETTGTASDPKLTQADLLGGSATYDEMALWRVSVSGATISAPVQLFELHDTMGVPPHSHSASDLASGAVGIERGGTGATTPQAARNNLGAVAKSGDTMTGALRAQNNTNYTTGQVRNIFLIADGNAMPDGNNGDICFVYTP